MRRTKNKGLIVKQSKNGKGVFAKQKFSKNSILFRFGTMLGNTYTRAQLPVPYDSVDDYYMQIGKDLYLGPTNDIDDFLNHSCDPNSGLIIGNGTIMLKAIKNISIGEEVTWDYSTTMDEDEWEMTCNCGSPHCRKRIRDFKYLPEHIQNHYIRLGIVPAYIYPKPSASGTFTEA